MVCCGKKIIQQTPEKFVGKIVVHGIIEKNACSVDCNEENSYKTLQKSCLSNFSAANCTQIPFLVRKISVQIQCKREDGDTSRTSNLVSKTKLK